MPDWIKRLTRIFYTPIPHGRASNKEIIDAAIDFRKISASGALFVALIYSFSFGFFHIDANTLLNGMLFILQLMLNAVLFSALFYGLLLLPLAFKERHWHTQIIVRLLRFCGILNVLLMVLFVVGMNRIIVKGSYSIPTSNTDLMVGGLLGAVTLGLTFWTLLRPIARYAGRYYPIAGTYAGVSLGIWLALSLNPLGATSYFNGIITKEDFCSALVSERYRKELGSGKYSRDCLVAQCVAGPAQDKAAQASAITSCPILSDFSAVAPAGLPADSAGQKRAIFTPRNISN